MALEIQKQLEGTSRSTSGTGVELDLVSGEIGANIQTTLLELIYKKKSDGTFLHFPSEEKLATQDKTNKSGAEYIGVDGIAMVTLSAGNLQAVLEAIDAQLTTIISGGGLVGGVILEDGTVPMLAQWNMELGFTAGGTCHVNPYYDPDVESHVQPHNAFRGINFAVTGEAAFCTAYQEGQNLCDNPSLSAPASEWSDSGDAVLGSDVLTVTYSTGAGSLTQANGDMNIAPVSFRSYALYITTGDVSLAGDYTFQVKFSGASASEPLLVSDLTSSYENYIEFVAKGNEIDADDFELVFADGSSGNTFVFASVNLVLLSNGPVRSAELVAPKLQGIRRTIEQTFISDSADYLSDVWLARGNGTTITLPAARSEYVGMQFTVKNGSTGQNTTVATADATTIEGSATDTLSTFYDFATYVLFLDLGTLRWMAIARS